jgi:predicted acetyltransferase
MIDNLRPVIEVRTIREEEIPDYLAAVSTGFHMHMAEGEAEFRGDQIDPTRTYGAFDGQRMVGTARSFGAELTVPGGAAIKVAGVTNVTVTGTHRRRGALSSMMRQQLEEVAGRGELAAMLIASEAPIYGRYGYGPATEHVLLEVDATAGHFLHPLPPGSVQLSSAADIRSEAPAVYERVRRSQAGAITRLDRWWDMRFGIVHGPTSPKPTFFAIYREEAGRVQGYVQYRIKSDWDYRVPRGLVEIDELLAATDDAYAALWRHCIGLDLVKTVTAENRPPLEALPWLLSDRRAVQQRGRADLLWVRLLDIPAALIARRYRVEDRLVLEVTDSWRQCTSRLALEAGAAAVTCVATDDPPELTIEVADLSAAYLGGTPLWPAAAAGRAIEHRCGAVASFDRLFGTDRHPFCGTWF